MEHGLRTKLLTAFVLAVVFASGVLLGFAADVNREVPDEESATIAEGERQRRQPVYELMDPTVEQSVRIDSIMHVHRARMTELHQEFDLRRDAYQADHNALIQETREAIANVFPADVRAEYRRLLAESDRRRAEQGSQDGRK